SRAPTARSSRHRPCQRFCHCRTTIWVWAAASVGRDELTAALAAAPAIVELRTRVGTLLVGDIPIAVTYASGTFTALITTQFLREVLRGADDSLVSLELIGGWEGPVRLESGSLVALIAQRTREPLISLGR